MVDAALCDRLDDLDTELDATDIALRALEQELVLATPPPRFEAPKAPAPRFQAQVSRGSSCDLRPELADDLVRRSRLGYSFGLGERFSDASKRGVPQVAAAHIATADVAADLAPSTARVCSSSSSAPGGRSSTTGRGPAFGGAPREGARLSGQIDRRVHARLCLAASESHLGFALDCRSSLGGLVVSAVRPGSAVGRWNAAQVEVGRLELQILPGDVVVEVGGVRIGCAGDLSRAVASARPTCVGRLGASATAQVDVVLLRPTSGVAVHGGVQRQDDASRAGCRARAGVNGGATEPVGAARHQRGSSLGSWADAVAASRAEVQKATRTTAPRRSGSDARATARSSAHRPAAVSSPRARSLASKVPTTTGTSVIATGSQNTLPGRCCRAVPAAFPAGVLTKVRAATSALRAGAEGDETTPLPQAQAYSFGTEARFGASAAVQEAEKSAGPQLGCPSDRFLSSRPASKSAIIPPPATPPTKMQRMKGSRGVDKGLAVAYANAPGLRGVLGAWLALVREALIASEGILPEEASTDAGSERGTESSSMMSSSTWSSISEGPGPGAYSPNDAAVALNTARGTPSFARYSAREKRRAAEGSTADVDADAASEVPSTVADSTSVPRTARGGVITPLPSSRSRTYTARELDDKAAARRPFYDVNRRAVDPAEHTASLGDRSAETGRLARLRKGQSLGPGTYEVPTLVPGERAAFIAPEPAPPPSDAVAAARSKPVLPGPAEYQSSKSIRLVYPRASAADFHSSLGHRMGFQKVPRYVLQHQALDPRWEAVRRRSLSAMILPVHREGRPTSLPPEKPEPGPGEYDATAGDGLVRRVRPDVLVSRWVRPHHALCEHEHYLFNPRPVDGAVLGDPRALLGADDDLAVRHRHASAVIHPLSRSLPARPKPEDGWHFYDPAPPPEPEGLASFSRRIAFEDFRAQAALLKSLQQRLVRRYPPSSRLMYSMPSLETTKARAPQHDFSRAPERPASDPGDALDSPREGDVLLLDLRPERELLHPRAPVLVDMARQPGRPESSPPELGSEAVDDFEELVLDPEPVRRRSPVYVDMARARGRPEMSDFSAHIWADANGVLYAYQPSAGLRLRQPDMDELLLNPRWVALRKRSPGADFARPLGRPGVDPRVSAHDSVSDEQVLYTNWTPPVGPTTLPMRRGPLRSRSPVARRLGGGDADDDGAENDSGSGLATGGGGGHSTFEPDAGVQDDAAGNHAEACVAMEGNGGGGDGADDGLASEIGAGGVSVGGDVAVGAGHNAEGGLAVEAEEGGVGPHVGASGGHGSISP